MALTNFSHGIRTPVVVGGSGPPARMTTGNVFFVHSTGSDSHDGESPDYPVATIDKAVGLCTASKADVIYVMPGHNEGLSATLLCVMDVAGVSVIGLGEGQNRPILDFDATAAEVLISADDCRFENIVLRSSTSATVNGIDLNGDDCVIKDVEFTIEATGDDFLRCIDAEGADRTKIVGCYVAAEQAVNGCKCGFAIRDSDDVQVVGNTFSGNFATACIQVLGTVGNNVLISGNVGRNDDATAGRAIYIPVAATGLIEFNRFTTAYTGPKDAAFDAGSMGCIENYISGESSSTWKDEAGVRVPFQGGQSDWQTAYCDGLAYDGGTANARGDDAGTKDPYPLFKVRGIVECQVVGRCATSLAGAGGALSVGVTGATGLFLTNMSAVSVDVGQVVAYDSHQTGLNLTAPSKIVRDCSISEWIHTANITAGNLDYVCRWRPLIAGSNVEALA